MEKQYPLIIVFYLHTELMKNPEIIQPFVESINQILAIKEANALALFVPTDGEERVECINPIMVQEADMEKINKIVEDIKKNFAINADIDVPDGEIKLDENPCECGSNIDGKCECN